MRKSLKMKLGAVGTTFALAGALAVVASGTTGAYFSETKEGGIRGTIGTVTLDASPMTFAWTNMMPGEQKSATVNFTNTGSGPQDFYIVFPNRSALHALNNLGSYGEVHVTGGETGAIVAMFDSVNLQDGRHATTGHPEPGYNSCSNSFTPDGCWPLPTKLPIAKDVARGATGSVTFSFNYPGKLGSATATRAASTGGGVFNTYPLTLPADANDPLDRVAGSTPDGLPFNVVAVQVGQTP